MSLPPLHPAIVHLPIGLVVLSFVSDAAARLTGRQSLRQVGLWAVIGAFLSGVVTIAAGYWDLNRASLSAQTREFVDLHLRVGWTIVSALFVLAVWRWRIRQQAHRNVTRPYLAASFMVFALTMFQGWYGGEMVYSHGAGVAAAGQGTEEPAVSQERLARIHDVLMPAPVAVGGAPNSTNREFGREKVRGTE